jgi:alcohol dehydrogenase class IV
VMTFNRHAIADKAELIGRVLHLPAGGFDGLLAWVLEFRRELAIPHALAEIGVSADKAPLIGREAEIDPSAACNPVPVDAAKLEGIFRAAVAGKLADVGAAA